MQRRASVPRGLQVLSRVMRQPELQLPARDGLPHGLVMSLQLISDRRAYEVRAIGVKAVADQEIDPPEIDETQVDGDLFAVRDFWPQFKHIFRHHRFSIRLD